MLNRNNTGAQKTKYSAVMFGGTTALHFLRDRVAPDSTVLVNGASGAVGSSAVQLAAGTGATVTAVTSGRNRDLVSRLGADRVIDYASTPLSGIDGTFDIVLDTVGNVQRDDGLRLAGDTGIVVLAAADLVDTLRARGRVLAGSAAERADDARHLLELLAAGSLDPVAETVGGLNALPGAYRRIDSGRKVGNLVVLPWA